MTPNHADNAPEPPAASYSSPPCYASRFPEYFGATVPLAGEALIACLNRLLEAERAGAKVLSRFVDDGPWGNEPRAKLRAVGRDESHNCAILIGLIHALNGTPSTATGDFVAKALAVDGWPARLAFLNRGQAWVVRTINEALPRIDNDDVRRALATMADSHRLNIDLTEAIRVGAVTSP